MTRLEPVFTVSQAVELLGGKETVTEYWLKKTARELQIGTRLGRKLVFTESQIQQLLDRHALDAQKPKPARRTNTPKPKPAKAAPKPVPVADRTVTPLQARPERARSYGRPA